jgi:hypothetical protein
VKVKLEWQSPRQLTLYDLFLGSGTTLIAAETTGRSCLWIELDPLYVDVAVRRWQAFTGEKATLLADGRTFDAVAADRLAGKEQVKPDPGPRRRRRSRERVGG